MTTSANWDFISSGKRFVDPVITYSSFIGKWGGLDVQNSPSLYYIDPNSKTLLKGGSDAALAAFQAVESWDKVGGKLTLTPVIGDANIDIYSADTINNLPNPHTKYPVGGATELLQVNGSTYNKADTVISNTFTITTQPGGQYLTVIHEIGHALGLRHPNGISYDPNFNTDMTVMSYIEPGYRADPSNGKPTANIPIPTHWPVTPMPYDVWAIQNMYGLGSVNGANGSTYSFLLGISPTDTSAFSGITRSWTIVDTGGDHDTIDLRNAVDLNGKHLPRSQTIDLREAIDSAGNWTGAATIVDGQEYVYIAKGSIIEDAQGSDGDDTITGNDHDNMLWGNGGNDFIKGGAGNDILYSGSSTSYDKLDGGPGDDILIGTFNSGAYYFANYGHDTVSVGGGSAQNYVDVDNFQGDKTNQVILNLSGTDTLGHTAPGTVTLRGTPDPNHGNPLPAGLAEHGTSVIVHGTTGDNLSGTLGDYSDSLTFTEGHFSPNDCVVGLGAGDDTISIDLTKVSGVVVYGSGPLAGFDNKDMLFINGSQKTGQLSLLQYDHTNSDSQLWDGGNGFVVQLKQGHFDFYKEDAAHLSKYTVSGHDFFLVKPGADRAFEVETKTPVATATAAGNVGPLALPFGLTLAGYNLKTDIFGHISV